MAKPWVQKPLLQLSALKELNMIINSDLQGRNQESLEIPTLALGMTGLFGGMREAATILNYSSFLKEALKEPYMNNPWRNHKAVNLRSLKKVLQGSIFSPPFEGGVAAVQC